MRTLALLIAAALLCSCTSQSTSSPKVEATSPSEVEAVKTGVKKGGQKVASATVRGAEAVGESVGTAYRGVKKGFEKPQNGTAYGPYPGDYMNTIRKHMMRLEGVTRTASFQFGKPERSYQNKGLLRGGDIDWQGWVVDVTIERRPSRATPTSTSTSCA